MHYEKSMFISKSNLQHYAVTSAHQFLVKLKKSKVWFTYKFKFIYMKISTYFELKAIHHEIYAMWK
jgi:hypothetical protein